MIFWRWIGRPWVVAPSKNFIRKMNGNSIHTNFYTPVEGTHNAEVNLREQVEKRIGAKFGNLTIHVKNFLCPMSSDDYEGWYNWTRDNYKLFWETVLKECNIKLSASYGKVRFMIFWF